MIHLLWPTARPEQFKVTHNIWLQNAKDPNNIHTVVAVDTQEIADILSGYEIVITYQQHAGVAYATYMLTSKIDANPTDIIILASDDFYPPSQWDTWLIEQFKDFDGCLLVRDGHQDGGCVTIPIMTFNCLLRLNRIIYHPEYRHQYSDAELWVNLSEMGLLKNLRDKKHPLFEHRHWGCGKRQLDNTDIKANNESHIDCETYTRRCAMPLNERLRVKHIFDHSLIDVCHQLG